jgi:hypothetical protein
MQEEGTPKFLKHHQGSVRGVAFSPKVSIPFIIIIIIKKNMFILFNFTF